MSGHHIILVPVDFSQQSNAALEEALAFAAKNDAKVHLLHVFTLQDKREADLRSRAGLDELKRDGHAKLEMIASAHRDTGRLGQVLWHDGDPASQIVATAKQLGADWIFIGACGRDFLTRIRLGSVAEAVTRDAHCTVVVVRRAAERQRG